jgi:hypothetical protein
MFGTYTKGIIAGLGFLVILCGAVANATGLGLSPTIVAWLALIGGVAGTALTVLSKNQNQPTLLPGQVVVNQAQMIAGTVPASKHTP